VSNRRRAAKLPVKAVKARNRTIRWQTGPREAMASVADAGKLFELSCFVMMHARTIYSNMWLLLGNKTMAILVGSPMLWLLKC
jgi:hypothetical protein